jgi:AcrR family transcriptional regulator
VAVQKIEDLLTADDLQAVVDQYALQIHDAVRERLEELRDAYEERLRKRGEEWRKEADALLHRLSDAEATLAALRSRFEAQREANSEARAPAPTAGPAESPVDAPVGVAADLRARGFEVIDKRAAGGKLWVMGPATELKPVMADLQRKGVKFGFAPKGGRATGGRAGWFTKARV